MDTAADDGLREIWRSEMRRSTQSALRAAAQGLFIHVSNTSIRAMR